jgi:hypothetical protein
VEMPYKEEKLEENCYLKNRRKDNLMDCENKKCRFNWFNKGKKDIIQCSLDISGVTLDENGKCEDQEPVKKVKK